MTAGALTMACLLLMTGAQTDEGPIPFNAREFEIPIRLQPGRKRTVERLELYYSTDRGKHWKKGPVATPNEKNFIFTARAEGEHWFTVIVVGKNGISTPRDPYTAPIALKISVDTLKPDVQILSAMRLAGQTDSVSVSWEAREENPDLSTLRLAYQKQGSTQWVDVPIRAEKTGKHTFRAGPEPITVRMSMMDTASNEATTTAKVDQAQQVIASGGDPRPPVGGSGMVPFPPVGGAEEASTGTREGGPVFPGPAPKPGPVVSRNQPPVDVPPPSGTEALATSNPPTDFVPPRPATTAARAPRSPVPVVNKTTFTLEYEVAKYGPSGVGGAEMYITRDDGRTWAPYKDVKHSPLTPGYRGAAPERTLKRSMTVTLREEGLYGFYLVVKSGVGRSKPAPASGTAPQMRMELDTTAPKAGLWPFDAHPTRHNTLIMKWKASDKHLADRPIALHWSSDPAGPWASIGEGDLPNTGSYAWTVPANVPPKVYLRLSVKDTAGNVAVAQTGQSVDIDLRIPEVQSLRLVGN